MSTPTDPQDRTAPHGDAITQRTREAAGEAVTLGTDGDVGRDATALVPAEPGAIPDFVLEHPASRIDRFEGMTNRELQDVIHGERVVPLDQKLADLAAWVLNRRTARNVAIDEAAAHVGRIPTPSEVHAQPGLAHDRRTGLEHLRDDAPFSVCSVCKRKSWDPAAPGTRCGMPQPSGGECEGTFGRADAEPSRQDPGNLGTTTRTPAEADASDELAESLDADLSDMPPIDPTRYAANVAAGMDPTTAALAAMDFGDPREGLTRSDDRRSVPSTTFNLEQLPDEALTALADAIRSEQARRDDAKVQKLTTQGPLVIFAPTRDAFTAYCRSQRLNPISKAVLDALERPGALDGKRLGTLDPDSVVLLDGFENRGPWAAEAIDAVARTGIDLTALPTIRVRTSDQRS